MKAKEVCCESGGPGEISEIFSLKSYIAVVIAVRIHLFPFRTEKLSSPTPMVLTHQLGE